MSRIVKPSSPATIWTPSWQSRGLIHCATFSEGGGLVARDVAGQKKHGAINSSATWAKGLGGKGLTPSTNAANAPVANFGNGAWVDTLPAFTFMAWVVCTATTTNQRIAVKGDRNGSGDRWFFLVHSSTGTGSLRFLVAFSVAEMDVRTSTSFFTNNVLQHVAVTYPGGSTAANVRIFVNGRRAPSYAAQNNGSGVRASDATRNYVVGSTDATSGQNFLGTIFESRLYNYAMPPQAVAAVYANPLGLYLPTRSVVGMAPASGAQTIALGRASSTETARALTVSTALATALARASETDSARALTPALAFSTAVGRASETDEARALTVAATLAVAIARATETDVSRELTAALALAIGVGRASEGNEARGLVQPQDVAIGRASETGEARGVSVYQPSGGGVTQEALRYILGGFPYDDEREARKRDAEKRTRPVHRRPAVLAALALAVAEADREWWEA